MPLYFYLNAIQELQLQICSLDQPIDCRHLRGYINVVAKAKKDYPEYFSNWKVGENFGSNLIPFHEPLGVLFSNSASPFR